MLTISPVAIARNAYKGKFGTPRQSGRVDEVETRIVFLPPYQVKEALRGIGQFTHLWVLWGFSANSVQKQFSPTVRPPRLGGNARMGVFATRSPFRPNPIGLSSVRLVRVETNLNEGLVLVVAGADFLDGTPVYDIKPYLPYTDSHPEASNGFAQEWKDYRLHVSIPSGLRERYGEEFCHAVEAVLSEDPRPAYQHDEQRVYAMSYDRYTLRFSVSDLRQTVTLLEVVENGNR